MDQASGIYAREFGYLDRYVQLGIAQERVLSVSFPATVDEDAEGAHELLDRIEAYLEGGTDDFADVTLALTMPTEQRQVLEAVREIPYGEEATVAQVARMTPALDPDSEADGTLVREALADNRVPLFVPDHRVRDAPSGAPAAVEQKLRSVEGL
jgi:methylated-DNA-[protein]-cysteine S-methyltransferase